MIATSEVSDDGVPAEVEAALARLEGHPAEPTEEPAPLARVQSPGRDADLERVTKIARAMVASGYFQDLRSVAQAASKILAGAEVGLGPFASIAGVFFVNSKPQYLAVTMASIIQNSGRFRYRVRESTDQVCRIEFFERVDGQWESLGTSEWTMAKAARAGLANKPGPWKLFPHAMLYNRAMAEGARMFCPSVFNGTAYVEGELEEEAREEPPTT